MLNACNLAIVSIMSMGMATSAMPNFDNPKNTTTITANTTQNYTINVQYGQATQITYQNETLNNEPNGLNNTGNDLEQKINLTANNNYINVIGNQYNSASITRGNYLGQGDENAVLYQNYDLVANNMSLINDTATKNINIYKLTPYNYNVDTTIKLTNYIKIGGYLNNQDGRYYIIDNVYLYKKIYVTTQENWDTLIDRQIVKYQVNEIINYIEDINNGFYYEKYEDTKLIYTGTTGTYQDHIETNYLDENNITITPNTNNYYVIEYVPIVKAHIYNSIYGATEQITWNNIMIANSSFNTTATNIVGINVIPSGTYEIVDIPGLMWQILTMPFAFVSQAFNLTLFPGTPYQLNISNLFLSIIAIMVFIWLITFFLKVKG